jgi:hypothetical protein
VAREDAGSKLQGNHGAVMRPEFAARPGKLLRVKNAVGYQTWNLIDDYGFVQETIPSPIQSPNFSTQIGAHAKMNSAL